MTAKVLIRWLPNQGKPNIPDVLPGSPVPVVIRGANLAVVGQYREMWGNLHKRALEYKGKIDSDFLEYFEMMLPCGQCRRDWNRMINDTPPDFNNYFSWTVARHNEVNRMLKKPEITLEEALKIWT